MVPPLDRAGLLSPLAGPSCCPVSRFPTILTLLILGLHRSPLYPLHRGPLPLPMVRGPRLYVLFPPIPPPLVYSLRSLMVFSLSRLRPSKYLLPGRFLLVCADGSGAKSCSPKGVQDVLVLLPVRIVGLNFLLFLAEVYHGFFLWTS